MRCVQVSGTDADNYVMIPYTLLVFVLGGLVYRACTIAFDRFMENHTLTDAEAGSFIEPYDFEVGFLLEDVQKLLLVAFAR